MRRRGFDGTVCRRSVATLERLGVWVPGAPHAENMAHCLDAVERFSRPRPEPGKEWAQRIVDRHRQGVAQPAMCVRLAFAALGLPEETRPIPPRSGPRPDARERAAGDEEAATAETVREAW